MVAGMIGPRARLLIRETRHGREREREIRKHKENKQQCREHIHAPLHGSGWMSVSLSFSPRAAMNFLSPPGLFLSAGNLGAERNAFTSARANNDRVFPETAALIRPLHVYLAMQRALAMSYASKYSVRDTPS